MMEDDDFRSLIVAVAERKPVGSPQLDQVASQGRAKLRRRSIVIALASGCVAVVSVGSLLVLPDLLGRGTQEPPVSAGPPSTAPSIDLNSLTRTSVKNYMESIPGVPMALPERLPEGYEWFGPSTYATNPSGSGEVVSRSSTFGRQPLKSYSRVEMCVHLEGQDNCARGDERIERELSGFKVVIALTGPVDVADRDFWREVPISLDLSVAWLPSS